MSVRTEVMERMEAQVATNGGPVAVFALPRLPYHDAIGKRFGIDKGSWKVLVEAIFPNAKSVDSVALALSYCKARGLDIFKRPVNIVSMWNSSLGREVETVWPSINEIQTTAARTNAWAGMDEPRWGPDETRTFKGRKKTKEGWESVEVTVTFPQWCVVSIWRLVGGQRWAFTEPVYWIEAYGRAGGARSELPTDMWVKRPRGQLHKVAKAASLRAAFPEESDYTDEEMAGKEIEAGGVVIDHEPRQQDRRGAVIPPPVPPPPAKEGAKAQAQRHDPETGEVWEEQASPTNGNGNGNGRKQKPGEDMPDIPPELRRKAPEAPAEFDAEDWLRNLEGAFSGCETHSDLAEKQEELMKPHLTQAAKTGHGDKAWDLLHEHVARIERANLDAG